MPPQNGFSKAFDESFGVEVYPAPRAAIAVTDKVHHRAIELADELGLKTFDLSGNKVDDAMKEIVRLQVGAVLGRGGLDTHFEKAGADTFWQMRESGVHVIVRGGNGVSMDAQRAFDDGVVVERTPRGNAEAVRIWQDLFLLQILDPEAPTRSNSPAEEEARLVKSGVYKKRKADETWNRNDVTRAVNPESLPWENASSEVRRTAELTRGKKIAVLGGGGRIGGEVIRNSPFLRYANVFVYDIQKGLKMDGVTVTDSKDEALRDADIVLLHVDGKATEITARELALLRDGAIVCNVARGQVIDPKALFEAIESGKVGRACLDVHFVEDEELPAFMDVPSKESERQPGHYAHMLRMHEKVTATNHSAASEEHAQVVNAEDAVRAVHLYNTRGEIVDGVVAPRTVFPYGAFVQESGGNGRLVPVDFAGPRFALQLLHDGAVEDLIVEARLMLGQQLTGKLNVVSGKLESTQTRSGRRNGVEFSAVDLPAPVRHQADRRMWHELVKRAEAIRGVHRATIFVPNLKA